MAYYRDHTEYCYSRFTIPGMENIGWLENGHSFPVARPSDETLDQLWELCPASVVMMRGAHPCDLCVPRTFGRAERGGTKLVLGFAEIRVFSPDGRIYAAPNMIYHYVEAHHYRPRAS